MKSLPWSSERFCSGVHSVPVTLSVSTACRWTNVPRRLSWPARRTQVPSISSDPNASSSPKPQSMPPSLAIAARRSSSDCSFGWTVKPCGDVPGPNGRLRRLLRLGDDPLELLLVVPQRALGLFDRDVAAADQRLGVELAHAALRLDEGVHQRL